jgi:DNA-binding XRE family transcriptional regulator
MAAKLNRSSPEDAPAQALVRLGSRIRIARVRRKLRQADLAQQIGRTRATVVAIEQGAPTTEIGTYVSALWALGLLRELELVADPGLDRDGQACQWGNAGPLTLHPRGSCNVPHMSLDHKP